MVNKKTREIRQDLRVGLAGTVMFYMFTILSDLLIEEIPVKGALCVFFTKLGIALIGFLICSFLVRFIKEK